MKLFKTLSALCMAAVVAVAVSACAPTAKSEEQAVISMTP